MNWIKIYFNLHLYIYIYIEREREREQCSPSGPSPLTFEVSRSHSATAHSVGLLCTSDPPVAETSIWQHTTLPRDRQPCPRLDSKPSIPARERPQTQALGHAATGIGLYLYGWMYLTRKEYPWAATFKEDGAASYHSCFNGRYKSFIAFARICYPVT